MRIALFHNLPSGGAKRAIYEWARRLVQNHQIDVYTLSSADHDFCDIRPFAKKHHIFEFVPRRLFNSPLGRLNQFQRWRDLGELNVIGHQIADEINAGDYDLVFAHTCLYTFIPTFLQFVEKPTIYILHEPFGKKVDRQFQRPYLRLGNWRKIIDYFDPFIKLYNYQLGYLQFRSIRHTKLLLANSRFTSDCMKAAFKIDTPVYYHGVDHEEFFPMPDVRKENFVLSVGELSPRKGFDFIVESLAVIPIGKRPSLRLACNMVNPLEKEYVENLATRYDVDFHVFTNLNVDQLRTLYNQARLCVYAPVLEPFGIVPLEAMACGTPVVGVREGGVQESVVHEHTGLLVEREAGQFGSAVQHLLEYPDLAETYGRNGRAHVVKNWTWDRSMAELERYLEEIAR